MEPSRKYEIGQNQVGQRQRPAKAHPVRESSAERRQKPHQPAKQSRQTAGPLDAEVQALMQIARQRGKRRVVRQPLEELADVGNPERPLKPGANFVETFGEGQNGS